MTTSIKPLAVAVRSALFPICLTVLSSLAYADESNEQTLNSSGTSEIETFTVTASTLKVQSPLIETPRSVSIIDQSQLQARQPDSVDEALRYQSGILTQPYGSDNDTDWFKIRGFNAANYLDGNRLYTTGYYVWTLEPYGLESIEVLKGPDAILFGDAPPGGVVNAVSKKPQYDAKNEIQLKVGTRNQQQLGVDINQPLESNEDVRFRLVGLWGQEDGVLDGTNNERVYVAPSLTWDVNPDTSITFLSSYKQDQGVPTNGFFPAYGTLIDTPQGKIDPSTNLGEPDYDKNNNEQFSIGYELEHYFDDVWSFTQKTRYAYTDLFLRSTYAFPNSTSADLYRGLVYRDGSTNTLSVDNQVKAEWYTDHTENTTLFGVEAQRFSNNSKELDDYGTLTGGINAFNPTYGNYTPTNENTDFNHINNEREQVGLYAQQITKLDESWVFRIGGRYDSVSAEGRSDNFTTSSHYDNHYNQFSTSAGLMYVAENGLTPYISYAESFEVITGIDPATKAAYKPLEGEQLEAGIKYSPNNFDGYINLALFDIKQKNALVTNPNTYVQTQTGELSSQGVELDIVAQITDAMMLRANYTFTDARTDETYGNGKQRQAGMIPRHMASTWLEYDLSNAGIDGLVIGAGARYTGTSVDNPASSDLKVPASLIFDAMASYEINDNWQAQVNVNNLTDETYVSACDYYCYYGEEMSATATINFTW